MARCIFVEGRRQYIYRDKTMLERSSGVCTSGLTDKPAKEGVKCKCAQNICTLNIWLLQVHLARHLDWYCGWNLATALVGLLFHRAGIKLEKGYLSARYDSILHMANKEEENMAIYGKEKGRLPGGKLGEEPGCKPCGWKEPPLACKTSPDHHQRMRKSENKKVTLIKCQS